jgi:hypothetical protein
VATYQAFCKGLPRAVAAQLGERMPPHHQALSYQVKLWSGNKDLHYECGVYLSRKVIELGLHFESEPITNLQLLGAFRARAKAIARALPEARIETWDKGWTRIWEPIPLVPFDAAFSDHVAKRFSRYIRVLEPILEEELPADVRWST